MELQHIFPCEPLFAIHLLTGANTNAPSNAAACGAIISIIIVIVKEAPILVYQSGSYPSKYLLSSFCNSGIPTGRLALMSIKMMPWLIHKPIKVFEICEGSISCAVIIEKIGKLVLLSNTGSLYFGEKDKDYFNLAKIEKTTFSLSLQSF